MKSVKKYKILLLNLLLVFFNVNAQIIPSSDSDFYYRLGGGQAIPVPVFTSDSSVPLDVDGNIGLNYNCGVFNPLLSITDSLNDIKHSSQNMEKSVIANATAAITEFPMYMIARANGPLYNLLNNGLFGAQHDLDVSTKSCQVLQNEIGAGQDPYKDWATASMGNDATYHMSLASGDSVSDAMNSSNDDLNQVEHQIHQDDGDKGVPWVQGKNIGRGGPYAGGKDQPPIKVINDTAIAGYNVALQNGRAYDDTAAPAKTPQNEHLVDTWSNPAVAAKWLTNVVGDEKVTTYTGGEKSSSPGVGLLPENSTITTAVMKELVKLVSGEEKTSIQNLGHVSAPHVMINEAVINTIRLQNPVMRSIFVGKLAQEVAAARLIDKAQLGLQLLEQGRQVPSVYSNKAAQTNIQKAIDLLHQDINDFLFNIKVNKDLVSNTVSQLMTTTQSKQIGNATIRGGSKDAADLEHGAIQFSGGGQK